jgi:hypothetical protein
LDGCGGFITNEPEFAEREIERERERDRGRETYFYIPGMPVNPEFHGDLHEKPFVFG